MHIKVYVIYIFRIISTCKILFLWFLLFLKLIVFFVFFLGNWDPSEFSVAELFQATMIILELAIMEERAQILGGICIFDLGDLTMQQAWHMSPSIAKKMIQIVVVSTENKIEEK